MDAEPADHPYTDRLPPGRERAPEGSARLAPRRQRGAARGAGPERRDDQRLGGRAHRGEAGALGHLDGLDAHARRAPRAVIPTTEPSGNG